MSELSRFFDHMLNLRVPFDKEGSAKALNAAARQADLSPTDGQKDAGNYRKGHYFSHGLHFIIENPIGSKRTGVNEDGKEWGTVMHSHYGYIAGTKGADGDEIDVFLNPAHIECELVFIINQNTPEGIFDEHKAMVGFLTEEEAKQGYLANYEPGWKGFGSIKPVTMPDFKKWLDKRPAASKQTKFATAYRFGGEVQGVHLRATLHKLLEEYKAKGMAVNDARHGDVHAYIDAPTETRQKIIASLGEHLKKYNHPFEAVEVGEKERMKKVSLSDQVLKRMFDRQGFTSYIGWEHDPSAYRRHWVQKRYRLDEDPKTHDLTGKVPPLAYDQLMGKEPVYNSQLKHPEQFAPMFFAPQTPTNSIMPPSIDVANPLKVASDGLLSPRIILVKWARDERKGPFTVAVDVDGTLAKKQEPFNPDTFGEPRKDVVEWVRKFKEAGARIIAFTVRGDNAKTKAWLKENDIPHDYVNENPDQPKGSSGKVIADVYWDDRGYNALDPSEHGPEILAQVKDEESPAKKPQAHKTVIEFTKLRILLAPDDILESITEEVA